MSISSTLIHWCFIYNVYNSIAYVFVSATIHCSWFRRFVVDDVKMFCVEMYPTTCT